MRARARLPRTEGLVDNYSISHQERLKFRQGPPPGLCCSEGLTSMKQSLSCTRLLHLGRLATCSPCWYGALGSKTLHHHLTGIDADVTYVARNDCSGRDGGRTGGAAQTTGGAWLRTRTLRFLSCSLSPSRSPTSFASRCPFSPLGFRPRYRFGPGPSARASASFPGAGKCGFFHLYPQLPACTHP